MEQLLKTILKQIEKKPFSYQTYFDLYSMSKEAMKDEKTWQLGIDYLKTLSSLCGKATQNPKSNYFYYFNNQNFRGKLS